MRTRPYSPGAAALLAWAACAASLVGCHRAPAPPAPLSPDARLTLARPGTVLFDIEPLPVAGTARGSVLHVQATYRARGTVARFRIWLARKPTRPGEPAQYTGVGFFASPSSDASALLADLARVLKAPAAPGAANRVEHVWLSAAVLGEDLGLRPGQRSPELGFTSAAPGHWTAAEVFAGGHGDFYLNLNPTTGQGEFAAKDGGGGDDVLKELARVL